MDAREEELCTDVEELTRENEYLKSELAGLRIQLDRSRAQLERRSSELYSAATADRDAEIAKLSEENGCLRRRVTELQNANQLLVNTLGSGRNRSPWQQGEFLNMIPKRIQDTICGYFAKDGIEVSFTQGCASAPDQGGLF